MINVCLPCTPEERYPACWDSCPRYLKQRAVLNEQIKANEQRQHSYITAPRVKGYGSLHGTANMLKG